MGLLTRLLGDRISAGTPSSDHDFWYGPADSAAAASGILVNPDSAMRVAAVYACVKVLAETLASLPLLMYRRRSDGGKDRAPNHPLFDLLHDQPNTWQTSFEWREMLMGHLALRGNAYNLILPGARGFVDQLIPLHPDRVRVEQLPSRRLVYTWTRKDGIQERFTQDQIFHLRGLSSDGITGISVVTYARETIGLAMATESHAARLFSQRAQPSGVLEHPAKLTAEVSDRISKSWQDAHAGLSNAHKVAVLEEGMKWHEVGMTNDDAQWIQSRKFSVTDIARWFRIPPPIIGDLERATFSNIENLGLWFVVYTMVPWLKRWEQAITRDLILAPDTFFAEFLVDGLLRGDIRSRYEAYTSGINAGWFTRNEARVLENLNPLDGLDEPLAPMNMTTADQLGKKPPPAPGPPPDSGGGAARADSRAKLIVEEAAMRTVRREITAIRKAAIDHAGKPARWRAWVERWYEGHIAHLVEVLKLSETMASDYCRVHQEQLLVSGVAVLEQWEREASPALAALALEGDYAVTDA